MTPEVEKALELTDIINLLKNTGDYTLAVFVHGALLMSLEVINERLDNIDRKIAEISRQHSSSRDRDEIEAG